MRVVNSKGSVINIWRMQLLRRMKVPSLKLSIVCLLLQQAPREGLGVVERFNRTFREKYMTYAKNMTKLKKTGYFKDAIPKILEEFNFIDDHRSIK